MTVPGVVLLLCFIALMILGAFLIVYSVIRLTRSRTPSELKVPALKFELKGPAWLVATFAGCLMVASPILVAALSKPQNVTTPPPPSAVLQVRTIPDPTYRAFRFLRDVSILDLRAALSRPWYAYLPGFKLARSKPRIRPGVLRNYMVVTKLEPIDTIHLVYGTSGRLDVRCLTHEARYEYAEQQRGGTESESWDVIADVSAIPVGQDFEIAVEATYWNGFVGEDGDDYTTYSHEQSEPEQLSVILLFPDDKPSKGSIAATEYGGNAVVGRPLQTPTISFAGSKNLTFYWSTVSTRPNYYYKLAWAW